VGGLERLRESKRRYLQFVGEQGEAVAEFATFKMNLLESRSRGL
jgi:hypothetical protein